MFTGCIPAHAAYFSIYETCKPNFTSKLTKNSFAEQIDAFADTPRGSTSQAVGSGAAVCVATVAHDVIMTPMDVMKQRLQLGLHNNAIHDCFRCVLREGGPQAFLVSLPLTLCMNLPYAAIMGTTNELARTKLSPSGEQSVPVYMAAGAFSGAVAAVATAPLDAIKTRLQTQQLSLAAGASVAPPAVQRLAYTNAMHACKSLYGEGGLATFYRGVVPRAMVHAPSVGICWTSYEMARSLIVSVTPAREPTRAVAASAAVEKPTTTHESPLLDHMLAGSLAGMVEHAAVFPIDTVKTHLQAASAEEMAATGTLAMTRNLVREHGFLQLFRGLSALMPAIGPAHALMFSGYEQVLWLGGAKELDASAERVACVGAIAGIVSTFLHDGCMVPAETIKQRLQLGYYRDPLHCFRVMLASGGGSFFRSLPTTVATNVPYCSMMMMSNESIKKWLNPSGEFHLGIYLFAGGFSGALAAALTTPLDVVKTRLQVQSLSSHAADVGAAPGDAFFVRYAGFAETVRAIHKQSGYPGFWVGLGPRIAMFGPSCAISWVAYESCKNLLLMRRRGRE